MEDGSLLDFSDTVLSVADMISITFYEAFFWAHILFWYKQLWKKLKTVTVYIFWIDCNVMHWYQKAMHMQHLCIDWLKLEWSNYQDGMREHTINLNQTYTTVITVGQNTYMF